jgi:two-component system cell cycle sensor histidine kinase/response regulator CckA
LIPFIGTWKTDERVIQSREAMGCHKDGTPIPLEVSIAHASLSTEEIDVLILRDISRQKDMHAQLLHTSKLATVGQMAAGLAHEMNQPLNVMRMAADNLLIRMERGHNDPEFLRDNLELIGEQAERVGKMTLHLRVFARTDASNLEPFDPIKSVCAAASLMEQQLTLANIQFEKHIPERCSSVLGHSSQLEQVVINLLTNAHDAIVDHPRPRRDVYIGRIVLDISEDATARTVVIRVGDTGGGIPRHIRDRIFDPFFTTKEVGRGTGLGLSICSTIVAEMKGKIEIVDTPEGVEMVVTIPTLNDEEQNDG